MVISTSLIEKNFATISWFWWFGKFNYTTTWELITFTRFLENIINCYNKNFFNINFRTSWCPDRNLRTCKSKIKCSSCSIKKDRWIIKCLKNTNTPSSKLVREYFLDCKFKISKITGCSCCRNSSKTTGWNSKNFTFLVSDTFIINREINYTRTITNNNINSSMLSRVCCANIIEWYICI